MSVWGLLSSITFSSSHGNQGQPFLLLSAFPRTLVKFVYVLTCDVITPKWRLVLGSADRYVGNVLLKSLGKLDLSVAFTRVLGMECSRAAALTRMCV